MHLYSSNGDKMINRILKDHSRKAYRLLICASEIRGSERDKQTIKQNQKAL